MLGVIPSSCSALDEATVRGLRVGDDVSSCDGDEEESSNTVVTSSVVVVAIVASALVFGWIAELVCPVVLDRVFDAGSLSEVLPTEVSSLGDSLPDPVVTPATVCNFLLDSLKTFLYICVETAETTEPIATPITDPAMPIFADNRNDVTAASAPAASDDMEMPLKKFFTMLDATGFV